MQETAHEYFMGIATAYSVYHFLLSYFVLHGNQRPMMDYGLAYST